MNMTHEKIKIAHFIKDVIFSNSVYELFELAAPGCNDFYIASPPRIIKKITHLPFKRVKWYEFLNPLFKKNLDQYDVIVLHSMTPFNQHLVKRYKANYLWIGMGYDYYDLIYDSFILDKTKKIALQFDEKKRYNSNIIKKTFKNIFYENIDIKDTLNLINYFSPVLEEEYNLISKKNNEKIPAYVNWNYSIKGLFELLDENNTDMVTTVNGNNILLGNNASLLNNHLEVLDFLKEIDLSDKKVIAPLSSGDTKYGDFIETHGNLLLKDSFVTLRDYLPYDEYIKTVSSCSNVIMNHLRQKGAGIIVAMLFMGAKVFLNEVNPLYEHYINKGAKVFSIDELFANPGLLDIQLSKNEINKNRAVVRSMHSKESAIKKTELLIEKVV